MSPGPQRSPLPTGAETPVREVPHGVVRASTKSAPQRSGDHTLCPVSAIKVDASTKSAPKAAETATPPTTPASDSGLNEARSPKERRPGAVSADTSVLAPPQRSPLPKGAETSTRSAPPYRSTPQRSPLPKGAETGRLRRGVRCPGRGLNEVRSPKERRPCSTQHPGHACCHNEVRSPKEQRPSPARNTGSGSSRPQRSPLPKGAETSGSRCSGMLNSMPQRNPLPK